jgi:hypothetical protein
MLNRFNEAVGRECIAECRECRIDLAEKEIEPRGGGSIVQA